jgi:heat-inducible transcriptional repressor
MTETTITPRQRDLLRIIIDKYIDAAQPIGSETVERESGLGVSPATIRNDMAALEKAGYLQKPHASAGRIPTTTGLKFYVQELMKEKNLSIKDEILLKERLWRDRFRLDQLLRGATKALAERTGALAVATTERGEVYYCGMANILNMPEFYDIDVTQTVLRLLDEFERMHALFTRGAGPGPLHILLGEDLDVRYLEPVGIVYTDYMFGDQPGGTLGVLGPARLAYPEIIPLVRYLGSIIGEMAQGW